MKTGILFIACVISISINSYGQGLHLIIPTARVLEDTGSEKLDSMPGTCSISSQKNSHPRKLPIPGYNQSFWEISPRLNIFNCRNAFANGLLLNKTNQYTTNPVLALTRLVMMAGSIPYFINSLKNRNKSGLKLSCQKTSFGASNKACKKVTSLTFSFPVGI